jgi:hypothetical protein
LPPAGSPHERRALGEPNRQRCNELLTFGVDEHDLDVMLEQHLPEPQALVHPRTAERDRHQLDAREALGGRR